MLKTSLTKTSLLALIIVLFVSCTPKPDVKVEVPDNLYACVKEKNQPVCVYKGKALVTYTQDEERTRFKAIIDKKCEDTLILKILGAFGSVMYDITYSRGHLFALKGGEDVTDEFAQQGVASKISDVLVSLNYPRIVPDESYLLDETENGYVFANGKNIVEVDKTCKIVSVNEEGVVFRYGYEEGKVNKIGIFSESNSLEVKFK